MSKLNGKLNGNGLHPATIEDLPVLEAMRQTLQRHRIQMGNRTTSIEAGRSERDGQMPAFFEERFASLERETTAMIAAVVKDHPMWPWMEAVRGIGPGLSGALLAVIDIEKADTISALWRYAGQGVNGDGLRDRPRKGEKLVYNAGLKRNMYLVATSFMRASSPYRAEYEKAKMYYQANRADWTPGHIDLASKRKMIKLFLSHMWVVWRDVEGLPLTAPYVSAHMSHDGIVPPWVYVPDYDYSPTLREHYAGISRYVAA